MEDFVTYQIAVKLKEKGFKEKCIAHYWEKINEHTPCFIVIDDMKTDGICIIDLLSEHNKAKWSPFIDAPTIAQALKWLRKEKELHVEFIANASGYCYIISRTPKRGGSDLYSCFDSGTNDVGEWDDYEEAALHAFEYILDNLI